MNPVPARGLNLMTDTTIVQYRTKPEQAEENQLLIEAVMAGLAVAQPAGLQYAAYRSEDGVTFVHVVHWRRSRARRPARLPGIPERQRRPRRAGPAANHHHTHRVLRILTTWDLRAAPCRRRRERMWLWRASDDRTRWSLTVPSRGSSPSSTATRSAWTRSTPRPAGSHSAAERTDGPCPFSRSPTSAPRPGRTTRSRPKPTSTSWCPTSTSLNPPSCPMALP